MGFLATPDDAATAMARHRPRAHGGAGDGGADHKTLRGQEVAQVPHHRGLTAEQMSAAGDVEKQAVRGIERHQRRKTVAPFRDCLQRLRVGGRVGVEYPQMRADGAGIGERQTDRQTERRGRVVERRDLQRIVVFGDDDAGQIGFAIVRCSFSRRAGALTPDAVDRQPRQPQAENPPLRGAVGRKRTHPISIP